MPDGIKWHEDLPENCPPIEAVLPEGKVFYRLVGSHPPSDGDFLSQRILQPERIFNVSECQARSISLFDNQEYCITLRKLPFFRDKLVVEIALPPDAGLISRTNNKGHYSWWRRRDFNPVGYCVWVTSLGI